jgi:hypothetical protein
MSNEVTDLLSALREGTMDIDEVARRFRGRSWPRRDNAKPTTYLELAIQAQQDPEPYVPGSYDDVAAAFHRGDLSIDQYDVLAQAIAESMRAEDRRQDADSAGSE